MKNKIVLLVLVLVSVTLIGCGSELGNLATGAAAGGVLSETLAGAEADLERAKQKKIAELEEAVAQLDEATTEVEQIAATAKVKALEKKVQNLTDVQTGTELIKAGTKVDWTDPAAVGGYSSAVISAALALYFRNKKNKEGKKRSAEKVGREKTINELELLPKEEVTAPLVKKLLFSNIGDERGKQKVA